jgi:radical SAM superfamily enzyme YgiQ (UPF0313 family)
MEYCDAFDFGIAGEGEITAKELLDSVADKKPFENIKSLVFRKQGSIVINDKRPLIENLDILPFPARDLLDTKKYTFSVPKKGIVPLTMMSTSRGCPYECVFCASKTIWGRNTRFRSAENVAREIKEVYDSGIQYIAFSDDTFTLNRKRVFDICNEIIKSGMDIKWQMMTRANLIDEEMLALMKKAGLVRMSIGVESGNPEILLKIKKGVTLKEVENAYRIADKIGIETRGSIMLGHPYETRETALETLNFAKNLKECKQMYINVATPYPGTEFNEMAKKGEGGIKLLTDKLSEFRRYGNAVIDVNDLTGKDLIKLQKKGFWMFYLTLPRIWYNIVRAGPKAAARNIIAFIRSLF